MSDAPHVTFESLQSLIERLMHADSGCRWLSAQSFQTIAPYTIEEAFELLEAIETGSPDAIRDELADQLYHLLIYVQLAQQAGWFGWEAIFQTVYDKQAARRNLSDLTEHDSPEAAHLAWRAKKRREKLSKNPSASILSDIPDTMPALLRSQKIQDRSADVRFDWETVEEVLAVLSDEIDELRAELPSQNAERLSDELGDILFTCVNVARHIDVNAEQALRAANRKFTRRFQHIESRLQAQGKCMTDCTFEELLTLWNEAKQALF